MEALTVVLDAISTFAFGFGVIVALWIRKGGLSLRVRAFLAVAMGIQVFVGVSNMLEHTGVTATLDPYEDYAEVLFLPFILFAVLSLQTQLEQDSRTRAEQALRDSEARYRTLVENIDLGIALIDTDFNVLMTNAKQAEMFGKEPGDLLGAKCYREFKKRQTVCDKCPGAQAMATGQPASRTSDGVREDGSRFKVQIDAFPVLNPDGTPQGFIEVVQDVTDRVRAEEDHRRLEAQVRHAQKLESLGVLAGGIAHDFNNLLLAILGNADLALAEMSVDSPIRKNVTEIKTASQRAAELARQMLAYSGKGKFLVERVDLNAIVEEMGQMLAVSVSKHAALQYTFATDLPPIEADTTQIRQVIMNLITNASEAIDETEGTISIITGAVKADREYLRRTYLDEDLPEGSYVTLQVEDTGCGMDADTQRKLFDPFFTTKFAGRGLGMAAVLGIVRAHQGAIKIDSEVGRGTSVTVLLPAAEAGAEAARPEPAVGEPWHGAATVLLVDDEPTVRTVGRMMLERLGMTVLTAADGREAVERFSRQADAIDCVILDLTMPKLGGQEALIELRNIRPDVRVVISSGYTEQDVTSRFADEGIVGFIQKPYTLQSLADVVHRAVGKQSA